MPVFDHWSLPFSYLGVGDHWVLLSLRVWDGFYDVEANAKNKAIKDVAYPGWQYYAQPPAPPNDGLYRLYQEYKDVLWHRKDGSTIDLWCELAKQVVTP